MAEKNRCGCRCNSTSSVGDNFICVDDMNTRVISNVKISGRLPWDKNGDAGFTGVYDWLSLKTCIGGTFCTKDNGNLEGSYVARTNATPLEISEELNFCNLTTYWTSSGPYYDSAQVTNSVSGSEIVIDSIRGDFYFCKDFNICNTGNAANDASGTNYIIDTSFSCDVCVSTPEISGTRIIVPSYKDPTPPELSDSFSNIWKIFTNAPEDSGMYSWSDIGSGLQPSGINPSP